MLGSRLGGLAASRGADAGVRDTNDDAQLSKLSCVRHGYFQDAFVHHFVRRPARRSPLINRGYYSRYAALRSLLLQFLALGLHSGGNGGGQGNGGNGAGGSSSKGDAQPSQAQQQQQHGEARAGQPDLSSGEQQPASGQQQHGQGQEQQQGPAAPPGGPPLRRQVLVLGAGYDTAFFQLAAEGVRADKYVEVDFLQVTQKKAAAIQQLPELRACLGLEDDEAAAAAIHPEEGRVLTERYCLLPADLRDLAQLEAALEATGIDPEAPTFVLSECVLVYLQPQHSRDVVRWLAEHLSTAAMAVYEQITPHDAFGQQMLLNLESRGCALLGIEATPTLEAQRRRFTDCGWHRSEAFSMDHVYSRCIDPADRRRIERLEIFDEFEEWHLIQQHYCIALGIKDSTALLQHFGLPQYAATAVAAVQSAGLGGGVPAGARPPVPRFVG